MTSYAELLGIDLEKLKGELYAHYPQPKYSPKAINPPPPSSDDWQPINTAANAIRYNVESIRRLAKAGKIRWEKRNGRTWVYYPDVERHAGKR